MDTNNPPGAAIAAEALGHNPENMIESEVAALDMWSHASLLFHEFEWIESSQYLQFLLNSSFARIFPKANVHFNIGIIHMHLGSYDDAYFWLTAAVNYDPLLLPAWFVLGTLAFEWRNYNQALRRFRIAAATLKKLCKVSNAAEAGDDATLQKSYLDQGLKWSVTDCIIQKNLVVCQTWRNWTQNQNIPGRENPPLPTNSSLVRFPADVIFEPIESFI